VDTIVFRFWISLFVPEIFAIEFLKWPEIDLNLACFWPPTFFGGVPPKFWDLDYKIRLTSDHVAKFRGDRPTEL